MGEDLTKLSKEELINKINTLYYNMNIDISKIEQLETDKQKLIEKLEERIESVKKCYKKEIEIYYDDTIKALNTSCLSKKEKEELINKRNCLLIQKTTLEEILSIVKGEKE